MANVTLDLFHFHTSVELSLWVTTNQNNDRHTSPRGGASARWASHSGCQRVWAANQVKVKEAIGETVSHTIVRLQNKQTTNKAGLQTWVPFSQYCVNSFEILPDSCELMVKNWQRFMVDNHCRSRSWLKKPLWRGNKLLRSDAKSRFWLLLIAVGLFLFFFFKRWFARCTVVKMTCGITNGPEIPAYLLLSYFCFFLSLMVKGKHLPK